MTEQREFVVVGAGLLGLAAGAALARRGRDVTVLEQDEIGHPAGGSKGSCRIFRLGYPDPGYVAMARHAREYWTDLESGCGAQLLRPTPHITFGTGLADVQAAMLAAGAPCDLLPAREAAARFPGVTVAGPALSEPESCVITADRALAALAARIPDLRTGIRVTGISDDGRRVLVRTGTGQVTCRAVVVCAGPWAGRLLAPAGVTVPSAASQEQVGYLAPADSAMPDAPIFICHGAQAPYGLPVPGSPLYKVGVHHGGPPADPNRQDQLPDPDRISELTELARRYLPGCYPVPVAAERCVYDNTPDQDFIVDRIGNVVIGGGTSGHGFKFGPLLGDWLASLAMDGAGRGGTAGETHETGHARMARRFALSRFSAAAAGSGPR